jgi:hypothetical protein
MNAMMVCRAEEGTDKTLDAGNYLTPVPAPSPFVLHM